jgi:hypothetical protein
MEELFCLYCGLCWLFMLHGLGAEFRRLRAAGWLTDKQAWWNLAITLHGLILAPLTLPVYVVIGLVWWALAWRDRRLRRQLRRYRDYLFDPVESGELPAEAVTFFEEHAGLLERLQFRRIGDYWLWRDPLPFVEREFLSADGRSFAAISIVKEVRHVGFYSVLGDGSFLETSLALYDNPETPVAHDPPEKLQLELHTAGTIDALFRRHEERLDHAPSEAHSYQPEDVRAVSIYGSRVLGQRLYAEGRRDELPPPPELPRPGLSEVGVPELAAPR